MPIPAFAPVESPEDDACGDVIGEVVDDDVGEAEAPVGITLFAFVGTAVAPLVATAASLVAHF